MLTFSVFLKMNVPFFTFRYLDFMEEYVKNKSDFMSVAYRAERSIEDELDRTSESDVATIAISYCIMFAYIAIALGQANSFSRLLVICSLTLYDIV